MAAYVCTGNFRFVLHPRLYCIGNLGGGLLGVSLKAPHAQAGCIHACLKLFAAIGLGGAFALTFHDSYASFHLHTPANKCGRRDDFVDIDIEPKDKQGTAGSKLQKALVVFAPALDTA